MQNVKQCETCEKNGCPDKCVMDNVFGDVENKYVAYINTDSIYKVRNEPLYTNNVGTIEVNPYFLCLGDDRYQVVTFGVELRPAVTKADIRKYIAACITKDFWMANHFNKGVK